MNSDQTNADQSADITRDTTEVDGPLTSRQVTEYRRHGYTIVPGFFEPDEVEALQKEVAEFIVEGLPRDVAIAEKDQNLQLIPLFPHSALFKTLPFAKKVRDAVTALLDPPVVKILDQMFYKPPGTGMGTNWHTDNAYFQIEEPIRGCAMWIAIHDADRANGTLKVLPDRFNDTLMHERDPASDHHIRTYINPKDAVHCELAAGGVVFFSFGTPHATGPNPTDAGRAGVGLHFLNFDYANPAMKRGAAWQNFALDGETAARDDFAAAVASTLSRTP